MYGDSQWIEIPNPPRSGDVSFIDFGINDNVRYWYMTLDTSADMTFTWEMEFDLHDTERMYITIDGETANANWE